MEEDKNYYTSISDVTYDDGELVFDYSSTTPSYYTYTTNNTSNTDWLTDKIFSSGDLSVNNDIVIRDENGKEIRVGESIKQIMDRLAIIDPDHDLMAKYPALQEAYNNYKLIEAMVKNDQGSDE